MSNIVGVQYVGGKQRKEDNILNSGAVWKQGEVINFNADAASKLAKYSDVWVLCDVDHDAETKVVGEVKKNPRQHEPQTFANVNAMDKEQLHTFVRTTLLKQLPDMELDALRTEVKNLLTLSFLDDQEKIAKSNDTEYKYIALQVTISEYEAYVNGSVELKLVPAQTPTAETIEPEAQPDTLEVKADQVHGELLAETTPNDVTNPSTEPEESLEAMLAKLDKTALREMCKELNITYANSMSEDAFRARILEKSGK